METQLKQRLVGAAVLMALGVIFIPILLDPRPSEPELELDPVNEFKPPPVFDSRVKPIDDRLVDELSDELESAELKAKPAQQATGDAADPPAQPSGENAEQRSGDGEAEPTEAEVRTGVNAWVVQLASFSSRENANALTEQLKAAGYTAYIDTLSNEKGTRYRVRVGPELERVAAEQIRDRLGKEIELEGFVVRYP